jgi:hypothetical protein
MRAVTLTVCLAALPFVPAPAQEQDQDWRDAAVCRIDANPEGGAEAETLTFAFVDRGALVWRSREGAPGRQATLLNHQGEYVISFLDEAGRPSLLTIFGPGDRRILQGAGALLTRHVITRDGERVNASIVAQIGQCERRGRGLD